MLQSDEIKQILPHRYPFLLVDRIDEMGEDTIVGRKCSWPFSPKTSYAWGFDC